MPPFFCSVVANKGLEVALFVSVNQIVYSLSCYYHKPMWWYCNTLFFRFEQHTTTALVVIKTLAIWIMIDPFFFTRFNIWTIFAPGTKCYTYVGWFISNDSWWTIGPRCGNEILFSFFLEGPWSVHDFPQCGRDSSFSIRSLFQPFYLEQKT